MQPKWFIEIPEQQKAFLINLQEELSNLLKQSQQQLEHVKQSPQREYILSQLFGLLDTSDLLTKQNQLLNQISELKVAETQSSQKFTQKLNAQIQKSQNLHKQSKGVSEFMYDQTILESDLNKLKQLSEQSSSKLAQTHAEYNEEEQFIRKTFGQIRENVVNEIQQIKQLEQTEFNIEDEITQIKYVVINNNYNVIQTKAEYVDNTLKKLIDEIPYTIQKARTELTIDMRTIVQNERQRRQVDQNNFNSTINIIIQRLERCDQLLNQCKKETSQNYQNLQKYIQQQLQQINDNCFQVINAQEAKIKKHQEKIGKVSNDLQQQQTLLNNFQATFHNATNDWKRCVDDVKDNTEKYVKQLIDKIEDLQQQSIQMLQESDNNSGEAVYMLKNLNDVWDNDWEKRREIIDSQIIQLQKLQFEITNNVNNEIKSRTTSINDIEKKMTDLMQVMSRRLRGKAKKEDVMRSLWLKVDK